jgi:hypothetical protein
VKRARKLIYTAERQASCDVGLAGLRLKPGSSHKRVALNYTAKDNWQGYKKAFNKKNQELSRRALSALFKLNRSISRAGYRHSPKAPHKYSINSLKRRERLSSLSFFL